jgi:hypothetical protein
MDQSASSGQKEKCEACGDGGRAGLHGGTGQVMDQSASIG